MGIIVAIAGPEAHQDLIEYDLIEHLDVVGRRQLFGETACRAQQRSTSSVTPSRPSARRAAYTANPRARRECSGL
jgi:hypothetical protein